MLRHGWLLLLLLFAVSLTASVTVHAREAVGSASISCGGETHAEGDGGQVPPDADQGVPHHHGGCHAHVVALQADAPATAPHPPHGGSTFAPPAGSLASHLLDPALRPPRA